MHKLRDEHDAELALETALPVQLFLASDSIIEVRPEPLPAHQAHTMPFRTVTFLEDEVELTHGMRYPSYIDSKPEVYSWSISSRLGDASQTIKAVSSTLFELICPLSDVCTSARVEKHFTFDALDHPEPRPSSLIVILGQSNAKVGISFATKGNNR